MIIRSEPDNFRLLRQLLLVCFFLLFVTQAQAWGNQGHTIVCEIAFQELHATARKQLLRLVQQESKPYYRYFRQNCSWADRLPDRQRRTEHYMNVPRHQSEISAPGCPLGPSCVLSAIAAEQSILADPGSSPQQQWQAVKFLSHWVADIHQPLHVSYADDRGGNRIALPDGFHCANNLHAYWDRCLIQQAMRAGDIKRADALARVLAQQITPAQRQTWLQRDQPWQWADESLQWVRQPEFGYCQSQRGSCLAQEKSPLINQAYAERFIPVALLRLQQAGVRLGAMLNQYLTAP